MKAEQDPKSRLIEAAVRLFAEKGFDAVGIREIAHLADVNSAAVSYHFGGKEGLYLAAVQAVMACSPTGIQELGMLPALDAPGARTAAIQGIRSHVRAFLEEILTCGQNEFGDWGQLLISREMQAPRPALEPFMREQMTPYVSHMEACIRILRPDLDQEARMRAGIGIHGQCLIYATHRGIIRLLLDVDPYAPENLGALASFVADFSLRGLGVPGHEIQGV
ncbi:MAG TPA: CerR family C-terminal domain-containing protein [Holophagaceae bacterium]|nr:CerR family C-terminal domain-containing protein [Holophagaceae bacterium]